MITISHVLLKSHFHWFFMVVRHEVLWTYVQRGYGVQRQQGTGHHGLAVGVAETVTIEYVGILLVVLLGRYRQHPRIGYHQCPVVVTLQYVARLESLP